MDRLDINSMYSTSHTLPQLGGSKSSRSPKSSKSPKSSRSPRQSKSYIPSAIDMEKATAIDKFRKANRLLQKELNEVKEELKKEKQKSSTLERKLKASNA